VVGHWSLVFRFDWNYKMLCRKELRLSFPPIGVLWRASRRRVEKSLDPAPHFALNDRASQGKRDRSVF